MCAVFSSSRSVDWRIKIQHRKSGEVNGGQLAREKGYYSAKTRECLQGVVKVLFCRCKRTAAVVKGCGFVYHLTQAEIDLFRSRIHCFFFLLTQ